MFDIINGWCVASISCLAKEAVVFFSSPLTCPWKATSFFSKWHFLEKQSFYEGRIHFSASYAHPQTRVGLEMMPCDVWCGKFLCLYFVLFYFLISRVSGTSFSIFKFTNSTLKPVQIFGNIFVRGSEIFCLYQLLCLFCPPLYIWFHNTELAFYIAIICLLGIINHR